MSSSTDAGWLGCLAWSTATRTPCGVARGRASSSERLRGVPYIDILQRGGGILSTV